MNAKSYWARALLVVVSAGCDDSSSPGTRDEATSSEIASNQALADDVQSALRQYIQTMTAPTMATVQACRDVHDRYHAQVRPWTTQMLQQSAPMDAFMHAHGGRTVADYACASDSMLEEVDHHHLVACTLTDLAADQAEVRRHVDQMELYVTQLANRCSQMLDVLDAGTTTWGPMMQGCQAWDGHCGAMMHASACGSDRSGENEGGRGMHQVEQANEDDRE